MSLVHRNPDWECTDFTYQTWQPDEVWCSLSSPEQLTAPQARRFFWQKAEQRILADLTPLIEQGWQPIESIGPEALEVSRSERVQLGIDPSEVLLWFMTLGVALLIQVVLDMPRRYTTFRPIQFRLRLQRRKRQQMPVQLAA